MPRESLNMAAMTQQEHVLIVDDDAEIRSLLRDYL